jgi:hypothetical protein
MANPKDILTAEDYTNYCNIRAISFLLVIFGSIYALGGVGAALDKSGPPKDRVPLAFGVGLSLVGLSGAIGGVAALRGNRRWAPLAQVMAAVFIIGFPVGTILGIVMLRGLSRYLDSLDRIRAS